MQKIAAKDVERLLRSAEEIEHLYGLIDEAVQRVDAKIFDILVRIEAARDEAREIVENAADAAETYFDERSEGWQDGDRGRAYAEWRDRLRGIAEEMDEIGELEITQPQTPDWVGELQNAGDFSHFDPGF